MEAERFNKVFFLEKINDIKRYIDLLEILVTRHLKVRYRGSVLGVYWSLLNPLILTGVYTAIFGAAFSQYYNNSILNYCLAAFTGLVVVNFFSSCTAQTLLSIVNNGTLLNKIKIPISIFPVSIVFANLFHLIVGAVPLLIIFTLVTSSNILNALLLLFPLVSLNFVCLGIGLIVSSLYVFFRDLHYIYELIIFVLWISSPVFYPSEIVSDNIRPLLNLNPLVSIIQSLRQITLSGNPPDLSLVWSSFFSGIILVVLGLICFKTLYRKFIDLL